VLQIEVDDLSRAPVLRLIGEHLSDMFATSPAESVHALDLDALRKPDVTFWTAWSGADLLACGALKELNPREGELKTMRTAPVARGKGVGARMLTHLLDEAAARGYERVSLETGPQPYFAAARRLYARHGFVECGPFGGYADDPFSTFMTRAV
jgi:putative acetyltransferase